MIYWLILALIVCIWHESTYLVLLTKYVKFEPVHDKTNKMTCAQQRLRSALVSAHSDQSLCSLHEESLGS